MIDTVMPIVKMIVSILPFVALCFASEKVNLEKPDRSKQFPVPVMTGVYLIFLMIFLRRINEGLLNFIDSIPSWFSFFATLIPGSFGSVFSSLGDNVGDLIGSLNLNFWIFFVSNTVMITLYMAVKKVFLSITTKIISGESALHTSIASRFYEYFSERNKWCLQQRYVQARELLKIFYYGAIILSVLLMLMSSGLYYSGLIRTIYYPVFGIIIVGELYFYLDGATKKEYAEDILGEDENAYRVVNYSLLRKFLRSLFGDKLLSENTGVNVDISSDITNDEIIRRLEQSEDNKISNYAEYIKALNDTGFEIDQNYIFSSLDLLEGKSILFSNPFYDDLIPYAFYPMNRKLLAHKKVLIVLGRHAIEDDIMKWVENGISAITNIPFMWNIGVLNSKKQQELDIGIVTRSDVFDLKMHNINSGFFEQVEYVVIIEPSRLISTAQIGLNLLVKKCRGEDGDKQITYCLCDKNCDGLVDAMSHILMTSITEVSATRKHLGTSSYMCWETDNKYLHHRIVPNISRYLGLGTELSFTALKNQVSKVQWFGGEAFPVTDMSWISKQYYYDLTKYAGMPTNQDAMDERFISSSNMWDAGIAKNNYFTVEDESFNMFEMIRTFSTRSTEQGFINVISSEYLLKDYMSDNASIFETDAKAIPRTVADYVRSNRNTTLRLILMMSTFPVNEKVLEKELSLLGIRVYDVRKQLWYEIYRCYADTDSLKKLPRDYSEAVETVSQLSVKIGGAEVKLNIDLLVESDRFNVKRGVMEHTFEITDIGFLVNCATELRSAGYVAEDEKGDRYYLGSELSGHIYQKYLPGQFFTFGGKYYEMRYLTADRQVLLRRAADHITGRPGYRQIREYTISGTKESDRIGAVQDISGFRVTKEYADISVHTDGYYLMNRYNDFSTAKKVLFEGEKSGIPERIYHNKEIMKIELPNMGGKLTDSVRYTVTTLINEIFRTLFAENQAYIAAVTDDSHITEEEVKPLTYTLKIENGGEESIIEEVAEEENVGEEITEENNRAAINSIYIIEDSQLDLGLTVTVERYMQRILAIVHDYLDWHLAALDKSLNPPPEPIPPISFTKPELTPEDFEEDVKSVIARVRHIINQITERIRNNPFSRKKKMKPEPSDKTEKPASDVVEFKRKPYHERYYLLYGNSCKPECLDLEGTLGYLTEMGLANNSLKQAREGKNVAKLIEQTFRPGKANSRYCDFCGCEIYGVEFDTLADGRDRCINCGRTAVRTAKEFRAIFEDIKRNLESFFGIKINTGIRVEMVNSKKLHRKLGKAFVPTPKTDGRVLGVAISDKNGYTLLIENGSPRMASMLTIAHELTHIWQYINWNDKDIVQKYGKKLRLEVYEGMAKWVEIQYAYLINELAIAKREEFITAYRNDEYGRGFLRYLVNYPFSIGTVVTKDTPFMNKEWPLDKQYCGEISYKPVNPIGGGDNDSGEGDDGNGGGGGDNGGGKPTGGMTPGRDPISGTNERNPENVQSYAYELLSEDEKQIYRRVLTAVISFESEIPSLPVTVTDEQAKKIVEYIHTDHSELFWFRHGATFYFDSETHNVSRIELKYCMTSEEAARRNEEIMNSISPFLASITDSLSDFEVALRVYENIIRLVDYDTIGLERQKKENPLVSPDVPDDLRSIYGVFVNKKAVCAGYAKATQFLLNLFGIECVYVVSDTHAWNVIKLEGDYYHLDTTWGDGSNTAAEKDHPDINSYNCFCITTEEVLSLDSHKPGDKLPLPHCTATKCNYHHRMGLYFEAYDDDRVQSVVRDNISNGNLNISFKCADKTVYDDFKNTLVQKGRMHEILSSYANDSIAALDTSYTYTEFSELFIITFYLKKADGFNVKSIRRI